MSHWNVLVTDYAWPTLEIEREVLAAVDAQLTVAQTGNEAELVALAPAADAILTCWKQVTPAVLASAPNCRIVSRYGIGLDNIAVAEATRRGIIVTNVPDFCRDEVSDHVMAFILAWARRVVSFAHATRQGEWNLGAQRDMPRLRGQTLGLVGYGNLARAVVPKALAFGLQIMAYTPRLAPDALAPFGVVASSLESLLHESDYVSLHVPLTPETRGLINAERLRQMKPTALLINTSRGAVIDEAALVMALHEKQIGGAALDVLTQEPPPPDHPLLQLDNVLLTPHAAFYSTAAIMDLAHTASRQVVQALCGERPDNVVNPTVFEQALTPRFQHPPPFLV
jgi:D-3-phosphoglycerate dehydrogenase / 2-oxoglutarate reductase